MSDGQPFLPKSVGCVQAPATAAGVATTGVDGKPSADLGICEPANWDWDEFAKILALQLVSGALGGATPPTKITSGLLRADGREIAGTLAELVRVIQCAPKVATGAGTQGRAEADAAAAKAALRTGICAILGNALMLTPEGLGNLEAVFTSGGRPRSELDRDAQQGKVPLAIRTESRFASWGADPAKGSHDLSMPILFGAGMTNPPHPLTPPYADTSLPMTNPTSVDGDRFEDGSVPAVYPIPVGPNTSTGSIVLFGRMVAFDMGTGDYLDPKANALDPESYQERARWAPCVELDPEKVWGDDEPPKKKKDTGDPGGDDDDEDEDEDEDGQDDTEPGDEDKKKNPQDPPVFGEPGAGVAPGEDLIPMPETGAPIGQTAEAFSTETGNAVTPHPVTTDGGAEDLEDWEEGGKPAAGVPASVPCPIDDPLFGTPGSVFGSPDGFSVDPPDIADPLFGTPGSVFGAPDGFSVNPPPIRDPLFGTPGSVFGPKSRPK